jgi:hypothetical protein
VIFNTTSVSWEITGFKFFYGYNIDNDYFNIFLGMSSEEDDCAYFFLDFFLDFFFDFDFFLLLLSDDELEAFFILDFYFFFLDFFTFFFSYELSDSDSDSDSEELVMKD